MNATLLALVLLMALLDSATAFHATFGRFLTTTSTTTKTTTLASSVLSPPTVKKSDPSGISEEIFVVPFPEKVLELKSVDDAGFNKEVLDSSGLQVVLFSSSWCAPCHEMKHTITSKIMPKHASKARFYVIDTDTNTDAVSTFGVRSIPSTILFKDGVVVSDIVGNVDMDVLSQQIIKFF